MGQTPSTSAAARSPVLGGYQASTGGFDEMRDEKGTIRPHWQALTVELDALGAGEFQKRHEASQRFIQENGITFNAFDESGKSRPDRIWEMDPIPMVVPAAEWQGIAEGLQQRVHLLNAMLADLYGPQTLLDGGLFPPSLVLNNAGFLRPLTGFRPPGGVFIHLYAADLARSPDGDWWVLSDRMEAPNGIGYALENRFISLRTQADIFRRIDPMRLRAFFSRMFESFEGLIRRKTEAPGIVLLSGGPSSESYFEQSFLARNLGYPLVQGADLTTRDGRVFLKTVRGLDPVDLILRNVPSDDCDPLELNPASTAGIPGLLNAARAGNVVLANCLGTGLAESPAVPPFLPGICKHLLGEEMRIPSAATWWCGQEPECRYVLDHLDKLVIKPVRQRRVGDAIFGDQLDASAQDALRARILADPAGWCGQEVVARSTVPSWRAGASEPSHFLMRVFLVAVDGGYQMMPGALTRTGNSLGIPSVAMQEDGKSKDTWMLAPPDFAPEDVPLPHTGPIDFRRSTAELTSHDADNIFWMGRYLERFESLARVLRMLFFEIREQDSRGAFAGEGVEPFLRFAGGETAGAPGKTTIEASEAALLSRIVAGNDPGNLRSHLENLNRTTFSVKERLSLDWAGQLSRFYRSFPSDESTIAIDPESLLDSAIGLACGLSGTIAENMTRALDWRFLDLGRRLERGAELCHLLGLALIPISRDPEPILTNLLVCTDSRYTYASRYLSNIRADAVCDLLLCDETNPRSVAFQGQKIKEHIQSLPSPREAEEPRSLRERSTTRLVSQIALVEVRELMDTGSHTGKRGALAEFLTRLEANFSELGELLGRDYFAHSDPGEVSARIY